MGVVDRKSSRGHGVDRKLSGWGEWTRKLDRTTRKGFCKGFYEGGQETVRGGSEHLTKWTGLLYWTRLHGRVL